ncbi:prolipoprotein diacylglyceryl transferase [Skermania piniformis]|uniref:Phosphatidylglycerol--prolipoprotein diacylglyceryl transferase n=1 Tax=Skermania pinensis TaxID=39122 RepID=A0ABX8S6E7_9ACTN|nr:prolipoprotein diacylglyceryl transferase [Skermania piniformis]QXQ12587.1 prolipoprotein diacylglyceryl transferase [Skermania piniformis]
MTFADERLLAAFPSPPRGVWELGPFPLRAYAFFIIVGIVVAIVWGDRRWVARGGQSGTVLDVAMWAVPFGLIGGRIYHVLTDWSTYFGDGGDPAGALKIWQGGLGIWGAVFFGGLGAWIGCRRMRIPLPAFADAVAPPILLAQAIGRLGNYFNQELYGRETDLPWGLSIYERINSAGVPDNLNGVSTGVVDKVVQPTFLYEMLWNLLVVVILVLIDRRGQIGHGRLFALYVALYCVGRFVVELLRDDYATHIAGIRINTFTAAIVFALAMIYFALATKGREEPEELRPDSARPWPWELIRQRLATVIANGTQEPPAEVAPTAGAAAAVSAAMRAAGAHAGESDADRDDDLARPGRVAATAGTAAAVSAAMAAAGRTTSGPIDLQEVAGPEQHGAEFDDGVRFDDGAEFDDSDSADGDSADGDLAGDIEEVQFEIVTDSDPPAAEVDTETADLDVADTEAVVEADAAGDEAAVDADAAGAADPGTDTADSADPEPDITEPDPTETETAEPAADVVDATESAPEPDADRQPVSAGTPARGAFGRVVQRFRRPD